MAIYNIMEDIVSNLVNHVMNNDPELSILNNNSSDIIAYVLNRISPRYITSERGMLHEKLKSLNSQQEHVDILFLIYEASNLIRSRRKSELPFSKKEFLNKEICFPHIIGEVFEEITFFPVKDAEVKMTLDGKEMLMIDNSWNNPYQTHIGTHGYYHFWPLFDKKTMGEVSTVKFIFSHPKFIAKEFEFDLNIIDIVDIGKSKILPVTLLVLKDGEELETIEEDFFSD